MSAAKETWPRVRLGDVCEVVLGGTPKTTIDGYWNGVIPWITPGEMGKISGPYVSDTKRKLTAEGLAAGSRLFPEKSVILSTRAPIGYVFINVVPMCTNQGCKTLVPSDRLLAEYLYWNLRGRTDELNQLGTGTTFKELSTIALKSIEIPLPPLSTQREIVARLEKELGQVDELAKKFAELETTAEAEFKATLKETFEALQNKADGTRMVKLGEVCEVITDGDWIEKKDQSESGIRLVQTGNIGVGCYLDKINRAKYISEETFVRLNCTEIFKGDVLVSRLPDPVGRACILPDIGMRTITAVDCAIIRFDNKRVSPEFFVAYSQSSQYSVSISAQVTGTTRDRISRSNLSKVLLPLPPLPTQRAIVARLDAAKARKEALVDAAKRGLAEAAQMRKAILKEAFE